MEFYQKLQALRREKGISQEELAEQLDVSRQAVSRWENGQGLPETEKIIQIGSLFNVSMDYLLKDEDASNADSAASDTGFYVNREMAEGYIEMRRKAGHKIALGVVLIILSILAPMTLQDGYGAAVMFIAVAIGVAVLIIFQNSSIKYEPIIKQPLTLDPAYIKVLRVRYDSMRRRNRIFVAAGVACFILGIVAVIIASELAGESDRGQYGVFIPIMVACGLAFIIPSTTATNAAGILADNEAYFKELNEEKANRWIWSVVFLTATAVFFVLGFVFDKWAFSWVVFPVAAMLGAIITTIKSNAGKK